MQRKFIKKCADDGLKVKEILKKSDEQFGKGAFYIKSVFIGIILLS